MYQQEKYEDVVVDLPSTSEDEDETESYEIINHFIYILHH